MPTPFAVQDPVYQAMYDYDAQDDNKVGFRKNDVVMNVEPIDERWMFGTIERTGMRGMLPANYVECIQWSRLSVASLRASSAGQSVSKWQVLCQVRPPGKYLVGYSSHAYSVNGSVDSRQYVVSLHTRCVFSATYCVCLTF